MIVTEDWRQAMHARDRNYHLLRVLVRGLIMVVALLSVGLIGIGIGVAGWWGWLTGGLGLTGAMLLWWEV